MRTAKEYIHEMLTEHTGVALCDSGGAYGRNWERNKGKTIEDFEKEPSVVLEWDDDVVEYYTISLYHYLVAQLIIDGFCDRFNKINSAADNWDGNTYGVSKEGQEYLNRIEAELQEGFNSYNGESSLSQVIQGTYCRIKGRGYILLQIHGGCDIRGGYTDARLFVVDTGYEDGEFCWLRPEDVYGCFTPKGADLDTPCLPGTENIDVDRTSAGVIRFSNGYDGYSLTDQETNEPVILDRTKGKVDIWLAV